MPRQPALIIRYCLCIENKLMVTKGGGGYKLGARDSHIHTTIYKIDKQQDLLSNTGNSTQYSVITYMGKESEKEWVYVYV